jgi:excisionase family DNA binding protein
MSQDFIERASADSDARLTPSPTRTSAAGVRLLTSQEASAYLGCCSRTLRRLIQAGRLHAYRLGRALRFRQEDLDRALEPIGTSGNDDDLAGFIGQQTTGRMAS